MTAISTPPEPPPPAHRPRLGRRHLKWAGIWLLALLLGLMSAAPIVFIILTSFKTFIQTQILPPVWPDLTNLENYTSLFTGDGGARGPLVRSLIVATATMLITLAVAIPAAYSLARYRIVRKKDIQFWIISTRMMPLIAAIVPLSSMLLSLHLSNTIQGLIIVYVGINLSFAVWLLTIFFQSVPLQIEEAAQIDGLSRLQTMWRVTIPIARPSIIVVAIFTWIFSWNEFLGALVLTTGESETLPVYLSRYASNTLTAYQEMAAVATVQIVPALLITFFAQRYIVKGLSMGALSAE
jgi:ABC-type glycerol-3-phosphate transport system permease component